MKRSEERRREIVARLSGGSAVSGSKLSEALGASRQIIVQDIAVLRAEGYDIISTHSGYVMKSNPNFERVFKVRHTSAETEDELLSIVRLGGTISDVFVWHKVYGKLRAVLNIFSERGVEQFMDGIKSGKSSELMTVTDGYHYHTVKAENEKTLDNIEQMLKNKQYYIEE